MMREILFRGKCADNGEFVEGYYCPCCFGYFPCRPAIVPKQEMESGCWKPIEVIPETVGQYTGLTDKNGKKIFEGDIVRYKKNSPCKIEYINCQFAMMWEKFYRDFEDVYDHDIEVVGNIHDNPELLGGADNGKV